MKAAQPGKGELTRAKLIDTTATLLHRHGYHAVGMNQILAESGTPRGSLYFHFPGGKEELACAALAAAARQAEQDLQTLLDAASDPLTAFLMLSQRSAQKMTESGWESGCPLATTALEAAGDSEPVRQTVQAHFEAMSGLIAAFLQRFGLAADSAAELGMTAMAAIEGALLLAKVRQSAGPIHIAARQFCKLVQMELAAANSAADISSAKSITSASASKKRKAITR